MNADAIVVGTEGEGKGEGEVSGTRREKRMTSDIGDVEER